MKKILLSGFAAALCLSFTACDNNETDSKEVAKEQNEQKFDDTKVEDDSKFVVNAADGGMLEVKLGELAQTNAASADVKAFGKMMVDDHSKANKELMDLAAAKAITVPATMGEDNMKMYNDLMAKKGTDFDKAYMDMMVDDHEDDVDMFRKESESGADAEIKMFASRTLPTLQQHHERAKVVRDMVK